uniref:C-type lectin domain-containing protein n=1 Tax=Caenorhabditis tropicalis TaxID=1561998 RepID=A0A1I7TI93_9PELO
MTEDSSILSYVKSRWKIFVGVGIAIVLLLVAFLLVLFLVILKPGAVATTVIPAGSSSTVPSRMTSSPGLVTSSATSLATITVATTLTSTVATKPTTVSSSTVPVKPTTATVPSSTVTSKPTTVTSTTVTTKPTTVPSTTMTTRLTTKLTTTVTTQPPPTLGTKPTLPAATQGGSTLPTIRNSYENDEMALFVYGKGVDKLWLGLKCVNSTSCKWDYDQGDMGYSNFAEDNCKNNYAGNCYIPNGQGLLFDDADDYCTRECGTLLSIHSATENRFVSSIYQYYSESIGGTLILGSLAASQDIILNRDHTPSTYSNLQNFTLDKNCIFFDVASGSWFSDDCSRRGWSLCKRPENQGLQTYLHDLLTGNIWIGLYCNASDVSSCYWTHQRGKVEMTYMESPFVKGSPNVDVGNCVTFNGKDGTWASRNCSDRIDVFCELPPTTSDPCDNNYDHHCYSVNQTLLSFPDAQKSCQESCGNLVSIHSELENRYIYSLFPTPGITSIGGIAPSRKTILWSDNSIQVYNNINNEEFQGNCIFMNVNSTLNGQWFGDKCSKPSQFVCKRPTGMKCN